MPTFKLILAVGIIIFFISLISIERLISSESDRPERKFSSLTLVEQRVSLLSNDSHVASPSGLKDNTDWSTRERSLRIKLSQRLKESTGSGNFTPISRNSPDQEVRQSCRLHFPAQCPMNPLVKYWDEVTECYSSPLRHLGGMGGTGEGTGGGTGRSEEVPLEDRRFVVFQPDLGGWNNIRMALEVVILFAQVTGRILVLPPSSVLHMLTLNENWDDNKSGMEDYFDFSRLRAGGGLQTMPMKGFLATVAARGLLSLPLPDGNTDLIRKPLWEYLEKACYTRLWSPGKQFIGFNITSLYTNGTVPAGSEGRNPGPEAYIGDFSSVDPARLTAFGLGGKRVLLPYDLEMHKQRAIYFPGDDPNRMLTHFYSYLFFATPHEDRRAKRFMRDRLRYHDTIFCTGSRLVEKLLLLHRHIIEEGSGGSGGDGEVRRDDVERSILNGDYESDYGKDGTVAPQYVAFHIRRGDFMKQTKIPAEKIVELTKHLVPDRHERIAYIATDEKNRSFFEPFEREYRRVFFLSDLKNGTDVGITNQNYVGMIEQVVCASAHTFVGTPLSTFTAYMTRMRGYMNRTLTYHVNFHPAQQAQQRARQQLYPLHAHHHPAGEGMVRQPGAVLDRGGLYRRTFYFLPEYMHMLQTKPFMHAPLNLQDFADVFYHIDDDSVL